MGLIDKIASLYDEAPLSRIDVPEWGDAVYYKPLTPNELDCVRKEVKDTDTAIIFSAQMVILKALDADGKRLFCNADRQVLVHKGSVDVIVRVSEQMRETPTVEDAEKN